MAPCNYKIGRVLKSLINYINSSLRRKLMVTICLLFLVSFTLFGYITYNQAKSVIETNVRTLTMQNIMLVSQHLDLYLNEIYTISKVYSSDSSFINMIERFDREFPQTDTDCQSIVRENTGYGNISLLVRSSGSRVSNTYYLSHRAIYNVHPAGIYYISDNYSSNEAWYIETVRDTDNAVFFTNSPYGKEMKMAIPLKNLKARSSVYGVLLFEINYYNLVKNIVSDTYKSYPGSSLFVSDKYGSVIFNSSSSATTAASSPNSNNHSEQSAFESNSNKSYIIEYTSPNTGLKIVNTIPYRNVLKDILWLKNSIIVLMTTTLIIMLLLISAFSSLLLKPIHQLARAMSMIQKENFTTRVDLKTKDETKLLADSFNSMAEDIEGLINKVYISNLHQKEAEILALQNQINPHFLYNTLDSIWGACLYNDSPQIASMIKSLSMIFRYNTSHCTTVSLDDEIKHIKNYMRLQNFRYDNKYDVVYDIPDKLYKIRIPKLTIQPLLENSIKHIPQVSTGKIKISAFLSGEKVRIMVADNGPGIDRTKIDTLNSILTSKWRHANLSINDESQAIRHGTGVGVKNVNARIKLMFGEEYGLHFLSSSQGTIVEISLPHKQGGQNANENSHS